MYALHKVINGDELVFPAYSYCETKEMADIFAVTLSNHYECPIFVDNHNGTGGYTVTVTKSNKE